ncbi:MAG: DUF72 domain-containing protein [Haliscomenobacteraceae bacterium CHB4]|nr:hypothetical protein [Saprospiraceae bacterium]MCE7922137.1 DUF72 domain-containing protein [Haliscomenobacteraceae bacterium CHB4]
MDFGKLPSVDNLDFSLPPEPLQNAEVFAALPKTPGPAIYIGATGYNMKSWVGKWYPAGAKDKDFLRHYGVQFNTIEHNTTHYRIPDAATVARWREETPADFRFCPKIPQTISHARDLGLNGSEIALFGEVIAGLGDKLGCCFLQLPPHFSTRDLNLLGRFLEYFPADIPLAVEVRHPSFFQPTVPAEDYFQLLRHHNTATVITDVAGRRDVCHMRLTHRRVLIRFVGNGLHPTDHRRIEEWSGRLKHWLDAGLHEVYFFAHEPDNLLAPELAVFCAETFSADMPGVALRGPKQVDGQQGSLF